VYGNHAGVVDLLCKEGRANVNVVDKYGKQAIHVAIKNRRLDIVKSLVERGGDVNFMATNPADTWSPLMYAVKYQFQDIIKFLLQCGADVTAVNGIGTTVESLAGDNSDVRGLLKRDSAANSAPVKVQANIFLSHFGAQAPLAKRLRDEFVGAGLSVWLDEGQFGTGDSYLAAVDYGMRSAQVVVALISDSFSSKLLHQKEMNLCDGLRKRTVSLIATSDAAFPPLGILGPILAPHPVFNVSNDATFAADFQPALVTIQSFVQNPNW